MHGLSGFKELKTLDDIRANYNVAFDQILTKDNYSHEIRHYTLYRAEAVCQYEKYGKRCSKEHLDGFIVACKDGSEVLIGHCCALNHLSLHNDQLAASFKYLSAKEREDARRHRVGEMLKQRDSLIQHSKAVNSLYRKLVDHVSKVTTCLPREVVDRLIERWKTSTLGVVWEYQLIKVGKDEHGKTIKEKTWYPHSCGNLKGLGAWMQLSELGYAQRITDYRKQLQAIPSKDHLTTEELDRAESVLKDVSAIRSIEREIERQLKLVGEFLALNNLLLTTRIVSNQKARVETAAAAHELSGIPLKGTPENYVADSDRKMKHALSTTSIRIQQ